MEIKRILLIENQYTQFRRIKTHLNNAGYTVYPTDEGGDLFNEFMDYVRIYLNHRYGGIQEGSRRKKVFEKIVEKINDGDFDAFIIDYILVGCSAGLTGIFLAEKFRDKGITTPIIFLSREKSNQPEITNNLNKNLEPFKWIHKGYAGREILEDEYFRQNVIKIIEECIGKSAVELLDKIASSGTFGEKEKITSQINIIRGKDIKISKKHKGELEQVVKNTSKITDEKLMKLLKAIENGSEQ